VSKVFNKDHYNADDNAKHQVIEWLVTRGFMAWVNPDQYGIDVQGVRKGQSYEFEVEVKHNWSAANFPFETIHFSNRKRKFATPDKLTWFVMLNDERTHALLVSGEIFLTAPIVTKNTIYTQAEQFVAIPFAQSKLIDLKRVDDTNSN
jgi:hypothetical protein